MCNKFFVQIKKIVAVRCEMYADDYMCTVIYYLSLDTGVQHTKLWFLYSLNIQIPTETLMMDFPVVVVIAIS